MIKNYDNATILKSGSGLNFKNKLFLLVLVLLAFLSRGTVLADHPESGRGQHSDSVRDTPPPVFQSQEGVLKGVVELGATGFNYFLVRIGANKEWKLVKSKFGYSLVYEHLATEEDIQLQLKNYIGEMLNAGVSGKNLHFVVSSGAYKDANVQKIIGVLEKKFKYVVNTVSPEQEARLALKSALPQANEGDSFVVDIGSGNTKISWVEAKGKIEGRESFGSKYLQAGTKDEEVTADLKTKLRDLPLGKRKNCYIIGGAAFELAKQTRKGEERYTKLNAPGSYRPETDKQRAGLNIYKAIADATGCENFVFDWDANFSIGFLLSLP